MTDKVQRLVELIHASPVVSVVVVAGAGGQALAWLLGVPGASSTVLEAIVPYGRRSMVEFLGHQPAQFVSPEVARQMARSAFERGLRLREGNEPVVGLGCTASIVSERPKRGDHRCCVAAWDDVGVTTYNLRLAKGMRERLGEEDVVSQLVLRALAKCCGIELEMPLELLEGERLDVLSKAHPDPIWRLVAASEDERSGFETVTVYPDGRTAVNERLQGAVLPGSFSPLHRGHERLAEVASEILGSQVVFEISAANVDKPPLEEQEVRRRLEQFRDRWPVVLTRAPTFPEKAALFPGCTFVIGWDTAVRLVHPRYYGGEEVAMLGALAEIRSVGSRFLVAGRVQEGVYHTLADVSVPPEYADLFDTIPESRYRADISSTELRGRALRSGT